MEMYKITAILKNIASTLFEAITTETTDVIVLNDATGFPSSGVVRINDSVDFVYTSIVGDELHGETQTTGLISADVPVVLIYEFEYLPENFEGLKIAQSFSFVNPIGYTPKFSVETMRSIKADKTKIDAIFDSFGLESDVEIEIYKLKSTGIGYDFLSKFAIDFESYEKFDVFSEFALKSVSAIDFYNNIKDVERQINLTATANLPDTQNYMNYVSLKSTGFNKGNENGYAFTQFEKNNDSKIYNTDSSLSSSLIIGTNTIPKADIYRFGAGTSGASRILRISGSGNLSVEVNQDLKLIVRLYKNNFNTVLHTFYNQDVDAGTINLDFNSTKITIPAATYTAGDVLFMAVSIDNYVTAGIVFNTSGLLFFDILADSGIGIISDAASVDYELISDIVSGIFNNKVDFASAFGFDFGLTSSAHLDSLAAFATIKPKEFISDLCLAFGLMLNFKLDGRVEIGSMTTILNALLNTDNAIEITDFKDLSIKHNLTLNFAGVSVGQQISDYEVYSYPIDWNKVLTFRQENRNASENLDLSLQKFRTDFSGILDYYVKRSQQKSATSKENFIFNPDFDTIPFTNPAIDMYDFCNPRNFLCNWAKFLSCCFQNFGKNTLILSSNGGNVDDLEIAGEGELDNFVLNQSPRLLPIEYNFTALIDDVDFSENILKINDNGTDVYLFVINSETTDNLSEQKITALKIQLT